VSVIALIKTHAYAERKDLYIGINVPLSRKVENILLQLRVAILLLVLNIDILRRSPWLPKLFLI
jgi:hypothetical protein